MEQAIDIIDEMLEWNVSKMEEHVENAIDAKEKGKGTKLYQSNWEEANAELHRDLKLSKRLVATKEMLSEREISIKFLKSKCRISEETARYVANAIVFLHKDIQQSLIKDGYDDISSDILASLMVYGEE